MWTKLIQWIPTNLMAILGILQAIVKFAKEVCTLIIDLLGPVIPGDTVEGVVSKVRGIFNTIDAILQKIKDFLAGTVGYSDSQVS